jgi:hypothetical protein
MICVFELCAQSAGRLGLKRTTFVAKIKKLGMSRPVHKHDLNRFNKNHGSEQFFLC